MTMPARLGQGLVIAVSVACGCVVACATASAQTASISQPPPDTDSDDADESPAPFEGEVIASTLFQGAMASLRLRSPVVLDTHYFGVEDNDVGVVGLAWTFSRGELRVIPGVGWAFSTESRPAPVLTLRWSYDGSRWITQGLWVQSLRAYVPEPPDAGAPGDETESTVLRHAGILDGIHASVVLGRAEVGPLIEYIRYRDEDEWKAGARAAWRLGGGLKLVGQIVGPGVEVRGGLSWEP